MAFVGGAARMVAAVAVERWLRRGRPIAFALSIYLLGVLLVLCATYIYYKYESMDTMNDEATMNELRSW